MGYSFNTNCPHCNTQLQLDSDRIGVNVQCAQCGKTFCVEEPSMPQAFPASMITPPAPNQPMPMPPLQPQPGTQNKSTASLVLGILGLIAGLFILAILILMLARSASRERARDCMSNMKILGNAFVLYSVDYRDHLPPYKGENGMKLLQDGGYIPDGFDNYKCPSSERKNPYAYVGEGLNMGRDNLYLPILIEYPKNHPKQIIYVLHLDGHVESHSIPEKYKTIHQVVEYILEKNNINPNDKGAAIVLANAKRFE